MYYEPNPQKKRRRRADPFPEPFRPIRPRRRGRGALRPLLRLLFALAVFGALAVLGSGLWVKNNFFSGARPDLAANASLPGGYTHVLLLGADAGEPGEARGRSDSIMIASFGDGGDVKLTSIMRDTMLDMGAQGAHKLNAAYKLGGGDLAMYAVNRAFALNITKYAAIDFQGIAKVIDAMGGIDLTITEAERDAINDGLKSAYKKRRVFNGVPMRPLTQYGRDVHMSGTHALFYARIRYIDSDFKRAERQRVLLERMLQTLKGNPNPIALGRVAAAALSCVETNLSAVDMGALGVRALGASGGMAQYRLPQEGAYRQATEGGVWLIRADLKKCRQGLYEFLYH